MVFALKKTYLGIVVILRKQKRGEGVCTGAYFSYFSYGKYGKYCLLRGKGIKKLSKIAYVIDERSFKISGDCVMNIQHFNFIFYLYRTYYMYST